METSEYPKRVARSVIFPILLAAGLTACGTNLRDTEICNETACWPKGSTAPDGLDEIKRGSTHDEVTRILGSRYERNPNHVEWPGGEKPLAEGYLYYEEGVTKYIEVSYTNGLVTYIYYGYEEIIGIE